MAKDFNPDAEDQLPEKKSSQQLLLLILLLLILVFAYLYFFTGLIKPRGEEPKPQPAPAAEAPVKKPLPPRPEAGAAKPEAKVAEAGKQAPAGKPEEKKGEAGKPAAKPEEKKPAPAAAKPEEKKGAQPPAKAQAAKPAAKPGAKEAAEPAGKEVAAAKPGQAAKETKPAGAAEKKGAGKPAQGKGKEAAAGKGAAPAKKAPAAAYALQINDDLAESEVNSAVAKLKKAGITQVVKTKSQKGELMHRLFLADFANRDEALEELERLKLAAPDAFMLKENGRYAVYAGSYLRETKATSEQNRLQAKGVQLLPKTATLPVAVYKLRAGAFADTAAAEKAAKSLKKAGLDAGVVKSAQAK
ncbi:hypothetical protein GMST_01770 [Geomonas silvestris]|uniref:SPOR domain-containing protein n=1 Tax=Geomonas silvestris TaxID=2740184 RepID=A0A6V8MD04_9BACT|nr:SPOR domain-containing protein [Geomonas silvestris]GFO57852.1 hypothetical protein GMST_01770 [Geomonas silvestris]